MSKPQIEKIIAGNSRIQEEDNWPKGDIQSSLKQRKNWLGLPVVVWVKFGKTGNVQESIVGTLENVKDKERWWEYMVSSEERIIHCRDYQIWKLEKSSELKQTIIDSWDEVGLKNLDADSTSPESFERNKERVLAETEDEKIRKLVELAVYPAPAHRPNKDPARQYKVIREIAIAYLEGSKLKIDSAFREAADQLGLTARTVRNEYNDWLKRSENELAQGTSRQK